MSYDIFISLPRKENKTKLEHYINSLEHVADLRFRIADNMYMEIDLERNIDNQNNEVNQISFHIPYDYLTYSNVDFDLYFEFIVKLAAAYKGTTEDLQLNASLESEKFKLNKPLLINNAVQLSKISIDKDELIIHSAYQKNLYRWDLRLGKFLGREITANEISNYDCYNRSVENSSWKIEANKKSIIVVNKSTNDQKLIKRTGEVIRLSLLNDNRLLSASSNKSIKLWDLLTGKSLATFKGHSDAISDIALFKDKILISSSIDGSIRFWDVKSSKLLCLILQSYYDNSWFIMSSNGDYEHSENFKGLIRWGFGKEVYEMGRGYGFDSKGSWNYTFDENQNGTSVNNLLLNKLNEIIDTKS